MMNFIPFFTGLAGSLIGRKLDSSTSDSPNTGQTYSWMTPQMVSYMKSNKKAAQLAQKIDSSSANDSAKKQQFQAWMTQQSNG